MATFENVEMFEGSDGNFYSQTGLRKNDKNENIVANSAGFTIDPATLEEGKEYRFTVWKNTKRKNENSPQFNLQIAEVVEDDDDADEGFESEDDDEFDFD